MLKIGSQEVLLPALHPSLLRTKEFVMGDLCSFMVKFKI
jgi:prolyl-tRNA synthetase